MNLLDKYRISGRQKESGLFLTADHGASCQ